MSIIDTLITNRVGGYYGIEDLNRVSEAMLYIAMRLRACGYAVTVSPRRDWTFTDRATLAEAQQYLGNLHKIRTALVLCSATPQLPDGARPFNVQEANNIEKMLLDVEDTINRMALSWFHASEIFCGEV